MEQVACDAYVELPKTKSQQGAGVFGSREEFCWFPCLLLSHQDLQELDLWAHRQAIEKGDNVSFSSKSNIFHIACMAFEVK